MNRIPKLFLGLLVVALVLGLASVALADNAKGKVKNAEATKVVVTDADGKDVTFTADEKTKVTIGGKEAKITDLKAGDEVSVTYTKVGEKMTASAIDKK
jgi:ABC-type Fe3+-hydroxamate transport system substrate-binding protein